MINRKILYGYRIRNGILEIVPEEQQTVKRIFTLYNAGASYQGISESRKYPIQSGSSSLE